MSRVLTNSTIGRDGMEALQKHYGHHRNPSHTAHDQQVADYVTSYPVNESVDELALASTTEHEG